MSMGVLKRRENVIKWQENLRGDRRRQNPSVTRGPGAVGLGEFGADYAFSSYMGITVVAGVLYLSTYTSGLALEELGWEDFKLTFEALDLHQCNGSRNYSSRKTKAFVYQVTIISILLTGGSNAGKLRALVSSALPRALPTSNTNIYSRCRGSNSPIASDTCTFLHVCWCLTQLLLASSLLSHRLCFSVPYQGISTSQPCPLP